ncbi:MAG: hypothetical protein WCD70_06800 [Alphaproteobacteria bacterium]
MFTSKPTPDRPSKFNSTSVPDDLLPAAVIVFDDNNRDAVKQLIGNLSPQSIDAFVKSNSRGAFAIVGQPYGAYDAALPTDPVAQLWQKDPQDSGSLIVIRRVGNGKLRVQAREGSNVLVLHNGDAAKGKNPAALLCVTLPGRPSQFMKAGDANVFEGAVFLSDPQASAEFQHVKDHTLRQCHHCTAGGGVFTNLKP